MRSFLALLLPCTLCFQLFAQNNHVPNEVLVEFSSFKEARVVMYDLQDHELKIKEKIHNNLYLMSFNSKRDNDFLNLIRSHKYVKLAQFNAYVEYRDNIPNDSLFTEQWALNNDGSFIGIANADISATSAWDYHTGSTNTDGDTIVMAVIDEGFKEHEDINYHINYAEIPDNGIDDDSNGYVDDRNGWNVLNDKPEHVNDSDNHGTHIAGIIGAKGNNSIGVTGVNWNGQVLRISKGGGVTESLVLKAYTYALEMRRRYNASNGEEGAYIVATNSSFGVNGGKPEDHPLWCNFYDTLGKAGILSVGATINSNINVDDAGDIPTTCPSEYFIGVTNSTYNDLKNAKSGYGPNNIDIAAPGTSILSTIGTESYGRKSGTSMASPHVVGAIGLMYSSACSTFTDYAKSNPDSAAIHVKKVLLRSVDELDDLKNKIKTNGRLNLHQSVRNLTCENLNISMNEIVQKSESILHPNPSNGPITLTNIERFENISIYNVLGHLIYQEEPNSNMIELTIEQKGLYYVKFIDENGQHSSQTIVVH